MAIATLFKVVTTTFIIFLAGSILVITGNYLIDESLLEKQNKLYFLNDAEGSIGYNKSKVAHIVTSNVKNQGQYEKVGINNRIQDSNYVLYGSAVAPRVPQLVDSILTTPYKVKVTFNSITVHNTHDPGFISPQGEGEFDLAAYVQGRKVDLTGSSINCLYVGVDFPPCGLGDSDLRETIYFNKPDQDMRAEIIVDIPKNIPLSIFTVGQESDECGRVPFPDYLDEIDSIIRNPNLDRTSQNLAIIETQKRLNSYDCDSFLENDNEVLGTINEFYEPTAYGAGDHTNVVSSSRDFTLRYSISVTAPAKPVFEKEGFYVESVRPPDKAVGITPSSPIALLFNEPVQKDSIKQNFQILLTNPKRVFIGGTTDLSADGRIFTFSPSPPLSSCTSYTIKVGPNLMSTFGRLLGSEFSSTFVTRSSSNTNICSNLPLTNMK
jgi:hypothetical protein